MFSRKLAYSLFAAVLTVGITNAPAQAQNNNAQGAVGNVIAALVNVQADDVVVIDLRNVLRDADIRILNNVLNNALNNNNIELLSDIQIQDLIDIGAINIPIDVNVEDVVVGVNVLGGTFVLFPLP